MNFPYEFWASAWDLLADFKTLNDWICINGILWCCCATFKFRKHRRCRHNIDTQLLAQIFRPLVFEIILESDYWVEVIIIIIFHVPFFMFLYRACFICLPNGYVMCMWVCIRYALFSNKVCRISSIWFLQRDKNKERSNKNKQPLLTVSDGIFFCQCGVLRNNTCHSHL